MTTRTNTSLRTFILASICCTLLSSVAKADDEFVAQEKREFLKLSPSLAKVAGQNVTKGSDRRVMSLLTFSDSDQSSSMLDEYGCQVVDSIGRIFIVKIPYSSLADMAADARIERIEAERMPRPAMDVTPQQINATKIFTGENLPQAFTGRGVVAGVFDNGFDFTHPAFLDADGASRARYYYDFCWENADGTLGYAITDTDEIAALGGPSYEGVSFHGTHVMGIMAARAVDGRYQGMAPEADIYAVHFRSLPSDFENPGELTSANAVLGFKYIFDQAEKDGKPCVVNFSNGESFAIERQRQLEGEALRALTGPGRIIVTCAGNSGQYSSYLEKPADVMNAGTAMLNGTASGSVIDLDIVTPGNQRVRLDFLNMRLVDLSIDKTITFQTDSILSLSDTCRLSASLALGDVSLKAWKTNYQDERGDVIHVRCDFSYPVFMVLCGALLLVSGNSPAWVYSDLQYSPFSNLEGIPTYCYAQKGHSLWWPGSLPGLISVGATGYKSSFRNIDGGTNNEMDAFDALIPGQIARFSSQGPTFDGHIKPDVVAPGVSIIAPYNSFAVITDKIRSELTDKIVYGGKTYYYTAQSGTSMATPVVAGTIALWLEAKPDLTTEQILDIFAHTCTHPDSSLDYPNNVYGYGQIDAYAGLLYILDVMANIPELSSHQPGKAQFQLVGRVLKVICEDTSLSESSPTLTVYSLKGEKMASTNRTSIDLSTLPAGIYAVQFTSKVPGTTGSTLIRL